ncbi:MAG: ATP-binding protein [Actinobacteria bacterium]|nr:ATP-binding protein [Actinomycetota bacterium]
MPKRSDRAVEALSELAVLDDRARIERILETARDMLGMDIAYFSQLTSEEQVIHKVTGDSDPFGFDEGTRVPIEQTYCQRMLNDRIRPVVPDARAEPNLGDLVDAPDSRVPTAYVGVPLQLSSGHVYGTLCCASREARSDLDERDVSFMRVLGRMLTDAIEHPSLLERAVEATAAPKVQVERDGGVARIALWLVASPKAVHACRRALDGLSDYVPEACMHDLHVVTSELVSNSVRHTQLGPAKAVGMDVSVKPEVLRAQVTDPGPGFDPAKVPEPDAGTPGGWGLYLVDQLTDRWGVERDGGLNRVWFELDLT